MQRLGDYIKEYSVRNKLDEDITVYSVTNSNGFCRDYFGKEVASNNKRTYKVVPRNAFAYNPSRINVGSVDYQHYEDRVIVSPLYNVFTVDEKILPQYLYFYLKSPNTMKRIRTVASGSVRDNLKLSMLCEFPIQVPSINRQQNIIELLEKAQRIIDEKNDELEKLDNLVKARFVEMFGNNKYETRIIKDVLCESFWLMPATPKYIDEGIPYITSKNIKNRILDLDDTKFISENDYVKISKNRPIKPGDILVSMIGTLGQTAVVSKDKRFYGQNIYLLRLNNDIISTSFFCEFFNSDDVQNKLAGKSNKSTQAYLKANHVEDLSIPIPPIAVQNDFATFVAQVDKSKFVLSNELTMCDFYIRLIHDRVMHSCINLRVAQ